MEMCPSEATGGMRTMADAASSVRAREALAASMVAAPVSSQVACRGCRRSEIGLARTASSAGSSSGSCRARSLAASAAPFGLMSWSVVPAAMVCPHFAYSASMVDQSHRNGRGSRSCDDDELSGRVIRFHGSVRLGNLIEAIHVIDGYHGIAGGDGVEKLLQYSRG